MKDYSLSDIDKIGDNEVGIIFEESGNKSTEDDYKFSFRSCFTAELQEQIDHGKHDDILKLNNPLDFALQELMETLKKLTMGESDEQ